MKRIDPPIGVSNAENEKLIEELDSIDLERNESLCSDKNFDLLKALWMDEGVKSSLGRANEFQLLDCAR